MELAELLKRKYESQQRLLQSLLQDLRSVEEKYAAIGVELEVGLFHISLLESKYQDDKRKIFTEVLHCWLDNYSRDDYIQDLCAALKAVNEPAVAERIQTKYYSMKEESLAPRKALKMEEAVVEQDQEQTAPAAMNSDEPEADSYSHISAPSKKPGHRLPSDSERENSPERSRRIPEGVDGSPEMFQRQTYFVRPTRDKTGHAELDLTLPSEALKRHTDKLKMLGDTMKKDGDTRFTLEINGRYCNTPWSRMTWTIHSTSDPVGGTVKAVVKINFSILRAIQNGIVEKIKGGVKTFVYEALDKEYPVDVE